MARSSGSCGEVDSLMNHAHSQVSEERLVSDSGSSTGQGPKPNRWLWLFGQDWQFLGLLTACVVITLLALFDRTPGAADIVFLLLVLLPVLVWRSYVLLSLANRGIEVRAQFAEIHKDFVLSSRNPVKLIYDYVYEGQHYQCIRSYQSEAGARSTLEWDGNCLILLIDPRHPSWNRIRGKCDGGSA